MRENNTNKLMNTLMYDALRNAGVKEADARAAAIEAGRNDLRLITFEYAINQVQSEMSQLRSEVRALIAEEGRKVIHTLLIAIGVATAILSVVISFN